jgi:hypothetical protein
MPDDLYEKIRQLPETWWQTVRASSALRDLFKFHLLGLLIGGFGRAGWQHEVYSGFLLNRSHCLLWITAGHVVDKLSAILHSPGFDTSVMAWLDWFERPGAEGVRVHNRNLEMKSWTNEGLDLGVVVIRGLDEGNIRANPDVRPVDERIWKNIREANIEGYYLIGFPQAWVELTSTPEGENKIRRKLKADIACLPVMELPLGSGNRHAGSVARSDEFIGRILPYIDFPEFDVQSTAGMSGGPVLAVERTANGQIAYRLAGLLSTWRGSDQQIRIVPIHLIVPAIERWEGEALSI